MTERRIKPDSIDPSKDSPIGPADENVQNDIRSLSNASPHQLISPGSPQSAAENKIPETPITLTIPPTFGITKGLGTSQPPTGNYQQGAKSKGSGPHPSISADLARALVNDLSQVSEYVTLESMEDENQMEDVLRKAIHETKEKLSQQEREDKGGSTTHRKINSAVKNALQKAVMRIIHTQIRQRINEIKVIEIKKIMGLNLSAHEILIRLLKAQCNVFHKVTARIEDKIRELSFLDNFPSDDYIYEIANETASLLFSEARTQSRVQFELADKGIDNSPIQNFIVEDVVRRIDNAVSTMLKLETIQSLWDGETLFQSASGADYNANEAAASDFLSELLNPSTEEFNDDLDSQSEQEIEETVPAISPIVDGRKLDLPLDVVAHGLSALSYKTLTPDIINADHPILTKRHSYRHLLNPNISDMVSLLKHSVEEQIIIAARATAPPVLLHASQVRLAASKQNITYQNIEKNRKHSDEETEDEDDEEILNIIQGHKKASDSSSTSPPIGTQGLCSASYNHSTGSQGSSGASPSPP